MAAQNVKKVNSVLFKKGLINFTKCGYSFVNPQNETEFFLQSFDEIICGANPSLVHLGSMTEKVDKTVEMLHSKGIKCVEAQRAYTANKFYGRSLMT